MSVSLEVVAQISRNVAAEKALDVELITIASNSADGHRVELLVTLARCQFEPRRVLLNLSRMEPAAFERQLRAKLREVRRAVPPALRLAPRQ